MALLVVRGFYKARAILSGRSSVPLHETLQDLGIGRLGEVGVEPRFESAAAVFLLAVAGQGNQAGGGEVRIGPEGAGYAVAVQLARQADVAEHHLGPELAGPAEPLDAVVGHGHLVPGER